MIDGRETKNKPLQDGRKVTKKLIKQSSGIFYSKQTTSLLPTTACAKELFSSTLILDQFLLSNLNLLLWYGFS